MLVPGRKYTGETAFGGSHLLGFTPEESGLYTFSGVFDKLRDGDLRLFDGFGEPSVVMNTPRGDESFCFWVSEGDTVWLSPSFMSPGMAGSFDLFVTEVRRHRLPAWCVAGWMTPRREPVTIP